MRAGDPEADAACAAAIDAARGDAVLFGQAVLTSCGLGVAIVGVDRKRVALLEEALDGLLDDALRARLLSRLAIALYYDPGRSRSGPLSAEAIAAARAADDPGRAARRAQQPARRAVASERARGAASAWPTR